MAKGDEFQFQIRAAAQPARDHGTERRDERVHASDGTAPKKETPEFSTPSEFSAGTRFIQVRSN